MTVSLHEVCVVIGCSEQRVSQWLKRGLLMSPTSDGARRKISRANAIELGIAESLTRAGIKISAVAKMMPHIVPHAANCNPEDVLLILDGQVDAAILCKNSTVDETIQYLKWTTMVVIPIGTVVRAVDSMSPWAVAA